MEFFGKVAVMTASGSGIGRACAVALAREGMDIVVADINDAAGEETANRVREEGRRALVVHCDVTSDESVAGLQRATIAEFGRVDLLHNHAGIAVAGPVEEIPYREWLRVFEVNVLSQVRGVQTFLPQLRVSRGHVVNTASSVAVLAGHPVSAMVSPYMASKAAVVGWTQSLAEYLRPQGIGVSLLAPDHTETNFGSAVTFYGSTDGMLGPNGAPVDDTPTQTPEHVAEVLVEGLRTDAFLLSSTPDIAALLQRQAVGLLDPAAMHGAYA